MATPSPVARLSTTATGTNLLIIGGGCTWDEFPGRARQIAEQFAMTILESIDGLDVRMCIAKLGEATYCISWDIWFPEPSIMAWRSTPDVAVRQLAPGA
jgi:hypothetical protein